VEKPNLMGFSICIGYQMAVSYEFLFAVHSMKYTDICKFVGLNV